MHACNAYAYTYVKKKDVQMAFHQITSSFIMDISPIGNQQRYNVHVAVSRGMQKRSFHLFGITASVCTLTYTKYNSCIYNILLAQKTIRT